MFRMFVDFQSLCHFMVFFKLTQPRHEDMAPFRGGDSVARR